MINPHMMQLLAALGAGQQPQQPQQPGVPMTTPAQEPKMPKYDPAEYEIQSNLKSANDKTQKAYEAWRKRQAGGTGGAQPQMKNSKPSQLEGILSLLGTALDPTHQMGAAYMNTRQQGLAQQDQVDYQNQQRQFQDEQRSIAEEAQLAWADYQKAMGEEQLMQSSAIADKKLRQDAYQFDREDATRRYTADRTYDRTITKAEMDNDAKREIAQINVNGRTYGIDMKTPQGQVKSWTSVFMDEFTNPQSKTYIADPLQAEIAAHEKAVKIVSAPARFKDLQSQWYSKDKESQINARNSNAANDTRRTNSTIQLNVARLREIQTNIKKVEAIIKNGGNPDAIAGLSRVDLTQMNSEIRQTLEGFEEQRAALNYDFNMDESEKAKRVKWLDSQINDLRTAQERLIPMLKDRVLNPLPKGSAGKNPAVEGIRAGAKAGKQSTVWKSIKSFGESHGFKATGTNETSGHNPGSMHYAGRAVDFRTRDKSKAAVDAFIKAARKAGYYVKDERTRPKGQAVWTGPHLHIHK